MSVSAIRIDKDLQRFLAAEGYIFGKPPEKIHRVLARLMGNLRYEQYVAIAEDAQSGAIGIDEQYSQVRSYEEANALMSLQGTVLLPVYSQLLRMLGECLAPRMKVADLGTWTGAFLHAAATRYPHSEFAGFDRLPAVIAFAEERSVEPNCRFEVWDYSQAAAPAAASFDLLLSVFGIDFAPIAESWSFEPDGGSGSSPTYHYRESEAAKYFAAWRRIARDGATLITALRIPHDNHFLALVAAAAAAGWTFRSERSSKVASIDLETETLPLLSFTAHSRAQVAGDRTDLLLWWGGQDRAWLEAALHPAKDFKATDALAVALYRALPDKVVHAVEDRLITAGEYAYHEVGRSGEHGYRLMRGTSGRTHLQLTIAPLD